MVVGLVLVVALVVVGVVAKTADHSNGRPAPPPKSPARVVFTDNFSDRASGWAPDANQDGNGAGSYQTDGYVVTGLMVLPSLNTYSVASPYIPQLTSMSVSVDATTVTGAPGDGAGVRCDQGARTGLRYTFEVFGNGQWVIFKIDQGATVLQMGSSPAIHTDGRANTIDGQCNEVGNAATSLVMTVNGVSLGRVTDSHPGGPIGWHAALVIYRSAGIQTVVRFNNFRTVADNPG
jgi:hypothetical protein